MRMVYFILCSFWKGAVEMDGSVVKFYVFVLR